MNNWIKRLLIVFEIGGGFLGLSVASQNLLSNELNSTSKIISAIFAGLFALGIVAGVMLAENRKSAFRFSLLYQILQIPQFVSPVLTYVFTSGFMLGVHAQLTLDDVKFGASTRLGSEFQFHFFQGIYPGRPFIVGINLVAVVFLIILVCAVRKEARLFRIDAVKRIDPVVKITRDLSNSNITEQ